MYTKHRRRVSARHDYRHLHLAIESDVRVAHEADAVQVLAGLVRGGEVQLARERPTVEVDALEGEELVRFAHHQPPARELWLREARRERMPPVPQPHVDDKVEARRPCVTDCLLITTNCLLITDR